MSLTIHVDAPEAGFAKLFGTGRDQILVMLDESVEGHPGIRFVAEHRGARLSLTMGFEKETDEAGWAAAERAFVQIDEVYARQVVSDILKQLENGDED